MFEPRSVLPRRPAPRLLVLACGALALAGCNSQSDRDAQLEARIAAAEAKAAAAEKRAAAAETAAGSVSPVTVGNAEDNSDPNAESGDGDDNANSNDQPPVEGDFSQQDNENQPSLDLQPDSEPQQVVIMPPAGDSQPGPVYVGSPPPVS